jgi:signal peptidase I
VEVSNRHSHGLVRNAVHSMGRAQLRAMGTSMAPTIHPGDLVTIEKAQLEGISPGEIVVFGRGGRLVTHRVVAKCGPPGAAYLITRGDRARRNDPPVAEEEMIGRVISIRRDLVPIPLGTRLGAAGRIVRFFFRVSDRGTYLYLYLAKRGRRLFDGRTMCRT